MTGKKFNLKIEMQYLLKNGKYFAKYNRNIKKSKFDETYHNSTIDPDGKKRKLIFEREYKLKQLKHVTRYLNKNKPGKILDVGCGHGWLLSSLNFKWNKFGLDVSSFALKSASKYSKTFLGDINNIKEKNFDYITILHVIEHIFEPSKFIKKVHKILKKKGTLVIETPNFDSAAARRYGNNFRLLKDKTHVSLFSEDSLIRFLRDNKFKIFKIEYPFFETPFFSKKNLLKILNKKQVSPPFYGSVITLFCKKY